jgi:hypothetical protein
VAVAVAAITIIAAAVVAEPSAAMQRQEIASTEAAERSQPAVLADFQLTT